MDSITHTLFGLALYEATNKEGMEKPMKRALLVTAIGGSQIPDIDVISQLWDTGGMYQMWHRGITHSIFLVPIWALLFYFVSRLLFRVREARIFWLALLAVFIHDTSDLFNAWGTGYLEPFSSTRITFGTIPIVDFIIWFILLVAFIIARRPRFSPHLVYKWAFACIVLHVFVQSAQGYALYQTYKTKYEQLTLSASFLPGHFSVIGKNENIVEITDDSIFSKPKLQYRLVSQENANLDKLFKEVPAAKTLSQWAPFVVVVDSEDRLGIYDPRFYRNGQSFLFEYLEKNGKVE
ncbi:metal-dependent hydrolase [Ectobacillus funiculus]|uniref:metal-dependent hydrolase n=1 Tax=Ectobacillus funiculus TaxID=137993 RepID=UPI00397D5D64